MISFTQDHIFLILLANCFYLILVIFLRIFYLKRKGLLFNIPKGIDVVFSENWSNGFSHKNFFTRICGAKKVLRISVTQDFKI